MAKVPTDLTATFIAASPSPSSEEKEKEIKSQSLRHVSCVGCRKRKMKCSRTVPCGSCKMRGEECIWLGRPPTRQNADIELENSHVETNRLRQIVDMLMRRVLQLEREQGVPGLDSDYALGRGSSVHSDYARSTSTVGQGSSLVSSPAVSDHILRSDTRTSPISVIPDSRPESIPPGPLYPASFYAQLQSNSHPYQPRNAETIPVQRSVSSHHFQQGPSEGPFEHHRTPFASSSIPGAHYDMAAPRYSQSYPPHSSSHYFHPSPAAHHQTGTGPMSPALAGAYQSPEPVLASHSERYDVAYQSMTSRNAGVAEVGALEVQATADWREGVDPTSQHPAWTAPPAGSTGEWYAR